MDRLAVAKGPRAERGGEALTADQVVDHADGIDAVDLRRDRHREARQIADEVRGPVDRVDDPDDTGLRRLVRALFTEESVVGASVEQNADDRLLGPSVHGGDHVGRTRLRVDAQITTSVGGGETRSDRIDRRLGQRQQFGEVDAHASSARAASMASHSLIARSVSTATIATPPAARIAAPMPTRPA